MAEDMIRWLYDLQHFGVKLGLDNIRALLDLLGRPDRQLRTVLVAGTNGKGSVAAMLDAMLAASDVRSGLFTSPHLVRPNERIRIAGEDVSDDELHRCLTAMRDAIRDGLERGRLDVHPSFFETITALAITAFRDHDLQAAVLEVGLGGRLDATNAVDADLPVIVSVDLDHVKTLGPTLELIAVEKAGVIKPGRPVISGVIQQRAIDVLRRVCHERDATFVEARSYARLVSVQADAAGADAVRERTSTRGPGGARPYPVVTLRTPHRVYPDLRIGLPGRHQIDNARVALAAFELLAERMGFEPEPDRVRDGLDRVRWPGRLQWVEHPGGGPPLLLDGAHNAAAVVTLTDYLRRVSPTGGGAPRPVLLFGAVTGKPLRELLGALAEFARHVVLTRPPVTRGIPAEELEAIAAPLFDRVDLVDDPGGALERARQVCPDGGFVLVTGSLYLLGEILGRLRGETAPGPVAM